MTLPCAFQAEEGDETPQQGTKIGEVIFCPPLHQPNKIQGVIEVGRKN